MHTCLLSEGCMPVSSWVWFFVTLELWTWVRITGKHGDHEESLQVPFGNLQLTMGVKP
jgi:hypothetical protein